MKIAIMQPSYIPWLGFFDLMKRVDKFVIYDDVQYTKNDWRNRNRIKTPQGSMWLTIPVNNKFGVPIKNVKVANQDYREKHVKSISMNYKQSDNYYEIMELIVPCILNREPFLYVKVMSLIFEIKDYLGIKCAIYYSSDIGYEQYKKNDRLIKICKHLEADEYLSPNGAENYLEQDKFWTQGIQVEWQNYEHPKYNQQWGEFVSHLSIIDLLFNHGQKSKDIL